MTSLYDVLRAITTGRAPDLFTALWAKNSRQAAGTGGGGAADEQGADKPDQAVEVTEDASL